MHRESAQDGFKEDFLAKEYEVASFNPKEGECCTAATFKPDLMGSPRSEYNKSAARVFSRNFNNCQKYEHQDEKVIAELFFVHLKTLHRSFVKSESREEEEASLKRRNHRKLSVSESKKPLFSTLIIFQLIAINTKKVRCRR